MSTETLTYAGTLVVTQCWCGIRQAIPSELMKQASDNGKAVYCPLGHEWVVKETEADRLARELKRQKEIRGWAEARESSLRDQLGASERSKAALKGHLTRARNKVAAGNCPVPDCGQHFANVREHMKHKHPDYALMDPETGEKAVL